jgi:prolyl 4-hydroxylase
MTPDTGGRDSLHSYIQTFDRAIEPDFCMQMIRNFEGMPQFHVGNGRGYRAGLEESAWTELDLQPLMDDAFRGFFIDQIQRHLAQYNRRLGLGIDIPMRPRIENVRIKRYRAGVAERFQPHFDSIDAVANRYLVFLWYLNDVAEGGETEFCDLGVRVGARTGRLLMFPPYWMFQHAGLPPVSNDKYIVSTYLMF